MASQEILPASVLPSSSLLLAEQNYKLAFWQNLNESINYRRFLYDY